MKKRIDWNCVLGISVFIIFVIVILIGDYNYKKEWGRKKIEWQTKETSYPKLVTEPP